MCASRNFLMSDPKQCSIHDVDPLETQEWKEALDSVLEFSGSERAQFLLTEIMHYASQRGLTSSSINTPYINSIPAGQEIRMPAEDRVVFEKLTNYMRWNAIAMVMRAGKVSAELGGHIATYGSIATLYEIGLHYFFHA